MSALKLQFETPFSKQKGFHILKRIATTLLERYPNDELAHAISENNWNSVVNWKVDYSSFNCPEEAFVLRQVLALFQKSKWISIAGVDRRAEAYKKFLEAEELCMRTNRNLRSSGVPSFEESTRSTLLFRVSRKISDILGTCPDPRALQLGFGPGASVGVSRFTSVRRKLSAPPTCTTNASIHLKWLMESHPHWHRLKTPVRQDAGKLTFVAKTAKTDRSIVVEPLVNTYLQKGVGNYIREKLKRAGCDLRDQSINGMRALKGSRDGTYATIDLSMASDTISKELVLSLLPFEWSSLLLDLRTPSVRTSDGLIHLQKFSSMGNGFTFELESLIFFALAQTIAGKDVSVYGDDIIVPTQSYTAMVEALEMFGFSVNSEKSFASGPFRESCGKDFFAGVDIRPVYVKEQLSVKELFRLHNFFYRRFDTEICEMLVNYIPRRFRHYGPDGYGDGHLLGEYSKKPLNRSNGWHGHTFKSFSQKPFRRKDPTVGDYPALLYLTQGCLQIEVVDDGSIRTTPSTHSTWSGDPGKRWSYLNKGSDTLPSSTMFVERGGGAYRLRRIYILS